MANAPVTQEVLIEFISDTSQLAPAVDRLEKMGVVEKKNADSFKSSTAELQKQVKAINDINAATAKIGQSGAPLKKTLLDINKAVKGVGQSFIKDLQQGAADALHEAGVSAKEFEAALEKVSGETSTLKSQLREMVESLAQMKVAGQDNSAEYRALAQQAGQLKDAIADANQEVKNFGSDTSTLDGIISIAGGVAGSFAVVQGAAALFGDESEELQKTLLRVNAAMAILQGLQQVQIVLQKESAGATLANTIATRAQTIAQGLYNFVVGSSIGLMKAFRIALAATGVGLLVIGIYELVQAFKSSNDETERANALLDAQKDRIEGLNTLIEQRVSIEEARANAIGAAESEIIRIQGRGLQARREGLVEVNRLLRAEMALLDPTSKAWFDLNTRIEENNQAITSIDTDIIVKSINLEKQLADERKEALKKRSDDLKKAAEEADRLAKERRAAEFADFKAGIELRLLATKEGSEEELEIKKELLRATLQIELDNEKLTLNQRRLLIQEYFKSRIEAEKKFATDREKIILENIASDIQAELQGLEVSNERKLELTETAINLAAEIELNAAVDNGGKIAEINAKRDKAIRDARIASLQEVANYEIALAEATNGPEKRRLQQTQDNANEELSVRLEALRRIAELESNGIQRRIQLLNDEKKANLISQKDYDLQYATLVDQQFLVFENAEKKKSDLIKATTDLARQQAIELTQTIVDAASQVVSVLDALFQLQKDKEDQALAGQKAQLAELREAGAITEKEAITRQKRIEAEERRVRREQAEREKRIAVFNAGLAVPQAVLKGLTTGGPILAAIYGSLALAQLLITASRPIPKFGKGKKDRYEGLAEVGETGTELVEHDGRMYVADKSEIVWLGKNDKVFNPQETAAMMTKPAMNTQKSVEIKQPDKQLHIDYEKMGKEVGKHVKTDVYVDGIHAQHIEKKLFEQYLNWRRGFK
jgi:hypothetical protein